jgi:hypothetical protein
MDFCSPKRELCYTVNVDTNHHIWQVWARALHRWGVSNGVASLLEAAGPLTLLGAQLVYLGQPVFHLLVSDRSLVALAQVLEDRSQTESFIHFLREAPHS